MPSSAVTLVSVPVDWQCVIERAVKLPDGSIHTPSGVSQVFGRVVGQSIQATFHRPGTAQSEPRVVLQLWVLEDEAIPDGSVVRGPIRPQPEGRNRPVVPIPAGQSTREFARYRRCRMWRSAGWV